MGHDYPALKAELTTDPLGRGYATMTDAQAASSLNTVNRSGPMVDIASALLVRAVLYPRGSWDRIRTFAAQGPNGTASHDAAWAAAQNLVDSVQFQDPIPMASVSGVSTKIQADMATLQAYKLTDGKGVMWAASEYGTGDPGDAAVLMSELAQPEISRAAEIGWGSAPVTTADVLAARGA